MAGNHFWVETCSRLSTTRIRGFVVVTIVPLAGAPSPLISILPSCNNNLSLALQ